MDADEGDSAREAPLRVLQRRGFRGYIVRQRSIDRVISMKPNPTSRSSLPAHAPEVMHWPFYDDMAGAERLISAVIDRDLGTVHQLLAKWPGFDFGLAGWLVRMRAILPPSAVRRREVRRRVIRGGLHLVLELVTYDDGREVAVSALEAGGRRLLEQPI